MTCHHVLATLAGIGWIDALATDARDECAMNVIDAAGAIKSAALYQQQDVDGRLRSGFADHGQCKNSELVSAWH
jgi:hypothetical protein